MRVKGFIIIFLFLLCAPALLGQSPTADRPAKHQTNTDGGFFGRKQSKRSETKSKDPFSSKRGKRKQSKQKDSFLGKQEKKRGKTSDGFTAQTKTKEYGEKSKGARIKRKNRKGNKGGSMSDGGFTVSNNYTMDYGDKATGKKVKKRSERKLKKSKSGGNDAFTSKINLKKSSPSASARGKQAKHKTKGTKKKRYSKRKASEDKQMNKSDGDETGRFSPGRKERKTMRKQKNKKEYGLGLPGK